MMLQLPKDPRAPEAFPNWRFDTLDFEYDAETQSAWMYYKASAPPFYSFETLIDMANVRESLRLFHRSRFAQDFPLRYFVMASRKPGVFKLGGDLATFARCIRDKDKDSLTRYAHACIDVIGGLTRAFDMPIVTISVIHGQALGGGLEAALAMDFIMAEETAKLGVPEVAFNSFPGMGAVSLLSRRLGAAKAETIIASGRVYSAAEMNALGVVDYVAQDGQGVASALGWMTQGGQERFERRLALTAARRRFFPLSETELLDITNLWVACCANVTDNDLRHMDRLVAAQKRKAA
jgi:DSF synthase